MKTQKASWMEKIKRSQRFWLFLLCLSAMLSMATPSAFGCAACAGTGSDIYVRVHAVVEGDHLKRLAIRWEFSETVVRMLMHEYDQNNDGRLDPTEKQALEAYFSSKLADSGYFTTLSINRHTVTGTVYDNQRLTMDVSASGFEYEIPLSQAVEDGIDLTFQVLDPDARFNFYYRHDSVTWNAPQGYALIHNAFVFPKILEVRMQHGEV
jgi:ABC-type uncharacterized transport system substrate-binding protein